MLRRIRFSHELRRDPHADTYSKSNMCCQARFDRKVCPHRELVKERPISGGGPECLQGVEQLAVLDSGQMKQQPFWAATVGGGGGTSAAAVKCCRTIDSFSRLHGRV
jgi:hypothetical protein